MTYSSSSATAEVAKDAAIPIMPCMDNPPTPVVLSMSGERYLVISGGGRERGDVSLNMLIV